MKTFAFVLVLAVLVAVALAAPQGNGSGQSTTERKCVPDKSYNDGCNTCFCNPMGHRYCNQYRCPGLNEPPREAPEDFWQKTE